MAHFSIRPRTNACDGYLIQDAHTLVSILFEVTEDEHIEKKMTDRDEHQCSSLLRALKGLCGAPLEKEEVGSGFFQQTMGGPGNLRYHEWAPPARHLSHRRMYIPNDVV